MENLQYGEMLGGYYINSGFYLGSTTGIYCDILGRVCGRLAAGRGLLQGFGSTPARRGLLLYVRVVAGFAPYRVAIPMG